MNWLIRIMIMLCFALFGLAIFYVADSVGTPVQDGECRVIKRYIIPAHTTTTWHRSGKTSYPVTHHYPTSYHVNAIINGEESSLEISIGDYQQIKTDSYYHCKYSLGRFTGDPYLHEILQKSTTYSY